MTKRIIWALLLIAVTVVVSLLSRNNNVHVDVGFTAWKMSAAFAYLMFFAVGLVTGALFR
jgi:Ca2+/H+ antiporter